VPFQQRILSRIKRLENESNTAAYMRLYQMREESVEFQLTLLATERQKATVAVTLLPFSEGDDEAEAVLTITEPDCE
jgi:hypothetical protein